MKKIIFFAFLLLVVSVKSEEKYSEAIQQAWAKMVRYYNSEMTAENKVIGMSLSDSLEMGPTWSHKRSAWYYGRINFLLGQYSVDPSPKREKAVLDTIAEYLPPATNSTVKPKP